MPAEVVPFQGEDGKECSEDEFLVDYENDLGMYISHCKTHENKLLR